MPKGKRIRNVAALLLSVNARKAVLCSRRWGDKPVPAAVVQNFTLVVVLAMIREGLWEYKKNE